MNQKKASARLSTGLLANRRGFALYCSCGVAEFAQKVVAQRQRERHRTQETPKQEPQLTLEIYTFDELTRLCGDLDCVADVDVIRHLHLEGGL